MKVFIITFVLYFVSCNDGPNPKRADVPKTIDKNKDQKLKNSLFTVARIDNHSQRVFVVIDSNIADDINKLRIIIKEVNDSIIFKDDLNISFFSDTKYAGYKDEFEDNKGIPNKEFFLSYLGEYNKQTKIYWTYPAAPSKKLKYILN